MFPQTTEGSDNMRYLITMLLSLLISDAGLLAIDYTGSTSFGLGLPVTKEPVDKVHATSSSHGYLRFSKLSKHSDTPFVAFDITWLSISKSSTPYFGKKQMGSGMALAFGISRPKNELWGRFGRGEASAPDSQHQNHFVYFHNDIGVSYKFYQTRYATISMQYIHSFYWGDTKWRELFPSRIIMIPQFAVSICLYNL